MQKEKHDGQKMQVKATLVVHGLQEREKPQSDSPTVAKESLNISISLAANKGFEMVSMDIRAAFIQADTG